MKAYKFTNSEMATKNGCYWQIGSTRKTRGTGGLCGTGWLHFFSHPALAVVLRDSFVPRDYSRLFLAKAEGRIKCDRGLKYGCSRLTLVKEIPIPKVTRIQATALAIMCAGRVCKSKSFTKWANDWLSGKNRTANAARLEINRVYKRLFKCPSVVPLSALRSRGKRSDLAYYVRLTIKESADCAGMTPKLLIKLADKALTMK